MIELKKITKSFSGRKILRGIDLKVDRGEVLSIIGPSASGKSTLIRTMNYLDVPESGDVIIDKKKFTCKNQNHIRRNIGMVFQNFNLFPNMNVIENIALAPINILRKAKDEVYSEATTLLKRVGLVGVENQKIISLSGGQKQRVAIARALAMHPKIMLFDEPTSALDPEMIKEVLDVISSFVHKGMTMAIVTHEMEFARKISDKIAFIDHGEIVEYSEPNDFFNCPKSDRAKLFLEKIL